MKDYASLKKPNSTSRIIAIVMVALLIVEMCSLIMLFSRVVGYSVDNSSYKISLTEGADKSQLYKVDAAGTGFIVPTFVADPDVYFIEPEDKINEKDFGFSTSDKNQVWGTNTDIEVFHLTYDEGKEEFTVISSNESKVFAPGTSETYKFSVANDGTHDLKYLVYLEAWIDAKDAAGNDLWIPLNSKFHNSDGTYFGADGTSDWHEYVYIDKTGEIRPLAKGSSRDYFVDWEWPYERFDGEGLTANDTYDTMLGDLAADGADLRAYIRIKTVAWIEDYWHIYTDVIEGKGTTSEDPDMVVQDNDETSTITAVPAEGYEFVEWVIDEDDIYEIVGDGKLTDPTLTIKPGSDIHAHAKFRLKPTEPAPTTPAPTTPEPTAAYWIVDSDVIEGKGTTTPPVEDPAKVEQGSGDTVTITATPDEGYEFIGWEIDGDYTLPDGGKLTDPTLVIKPGSDIHAHAKFKPVPKYWIVDTDVIEGKGTTTPPVSDPVKVEQGSGDTVSITATPTDGYEFIGWEIDGDYTLPEGGSLTDPNLVIKPASDIHAHAKFRPVTPEPEYWIVDTDVIEGEGTTSPTKENPVKVIQNSDETVTIHAEPSDGYEFVGWEIDGDYTLPEGGSLTDPTLVIKPGSDVHAHARFRPVPTEPSTEVPATTPAETTVSPTSAPTPSATTAPAVTPQTGDKTNNILWIILAISALVALIVLFFVYRKVRKREKAEG